MVGSIDLTVQQVAIGIELQPVDGLWMTSGTSRDLSASVVDALGHSVLGSTLHFTSSDATVAAVSSFGRVTATGDGTALITVTSASLTNSTSAVVSTPP